MGGGAADSEGVRGEALRGLAGQHRGTRLVVDSEKNFKVIDRA